MYAKVRILRRSASNRRKRDSTKETPKLTDLRRLMTDSNLRCPVANAMVNALPPTPDGTCIGDMATDMVGVMLSTAAELVRALSAHVEHRIGARDPVWKLKLTQHGNRERRRGGTYAQNPTT